MAIWSNWQTQGAGRPPDPTRTGMFGDSEAASDYSLMSPEQKQAYGKMRETEISKAREAYGRRFGEAEGATATAQGTVASALEQQRQAALGTTPSVAEQQMRRGTDQSIANALALSAAGRGGNAALAGRQAATAQAGMSQSAVGDASMLRAGEIAQARQGYGDLAMSQQQAALARQQLAQQGQLSLEELEMRRFAEAGAQQTARDIAEYNARIQREIAVRDQKARLAGAGIQAGGQLLGSILGGSMMSDERRKKDIEDDGEGIAGVFRALKPKTYRYKKDVGEHDFGEGQRVAGVMAQDLEKTKLGRAIVKERGGAKMLDLRGVASVAMAGIADLYRRLDAKTEAAHG